MKIITRITAWRVDRAVRRMLINDECAAIDFVLGSRLDDLDVMPDDSIERLIQAINEAPVQDQERRA